MIARRKFLKFLASSPLAATPAVSSMITALLASAPDPAFAQSYDVLRGARRSLGPDGVITAPGDALNVFEFEPASEEGRVKPRRAFRERTGALGLSGEWRGRRCDPRCQP